MHVFIPNIAVCRLLLLFHLFMLIASAAAQNLPPEDCMNGLDDDGDGYIDCYDVDCQCDIPPTCFTPIPPNTGVTVGLAWKSDPLPYSPLGVMVVGNLNPQTDSMPEIVVPFSSTWDDPENSGLLFYAGNGANAHAPDTMFMPTLHDNSPPPVIGDIDRDGKPELIIVDVESNIMVYRNFTPGNVPAMTFWLSSVQKPEISGSGPMLADFDGDGMSEVLIGNEIFIFDFTGPTSPSLRKVIDGGANPEGYIYNTLPANFSKHTKSPAVADLLTIADCNGDPDCNGLELAAGPVIYSVDLDTTDGDGFQLKIQRDLNFMESPDEFVDGYTAIADMDIDGTPDIVVIGRGKVGLEPPGLGIYVWNKNGLVKFMPTPVSDAVTGFLYCMPMIANVFDDTKRGLAKDFPEVVMYAENNLYCFNLHATNFPDLQAWWFTSIGPDLLTETSPTAFDFNGDGFSEIVFEDNEEIRILYGGHLPFPPGVDANRNWATFTLSTQITQSLYEIPIIADVNNDGQAEIVVAGGKDNDTSSFPITVQILKSGGIPWSPCRNLWNQFNYNIVNINDDLSVPVQQQPNWLEFPAPGSGKRPLNMALAQRGPINGPAFIPLADLGSSVDTFYCDLDSLRVRLRICNSGSTSSPPGLSLRWYEGDPTTPGAILYGSPYTYPSTIAKDSCNFWQISLPLPPNGTLYGIVNDNGSIAGPIDLATDFPSTTLMECDYLDNLFSFQVSYTTPVLDLGPDQSICKDANVVLNATPGFSRYRWQDGSQNASFTAQGIGTYWVEAWDICGNLFTDTLQLLAIPTPTLALGPDVSICSGNEVSLVVAGFDQVNWNSLGAAVCAGCPVFTFVPSADITLEVAAQSGACMERDTISIALLPLPQINGQVVETHCGDADGSINILITSSLPYQIEWSGGQTDASLSGLVASAYSVTVTDNAGCTQSETYLVAGSIPVVLGPAVLTHVLCFGAQTGSIVTSLDSGTAPYQFAWSGGQNTDILSGVPAGNYTLTVTDAEGCTATNSYQLSEPPDLTLQSTIDGTSCTSATADIFLTAQGGTPPYGFTWAGGQNTPTLLDINPGAYSVTLSDGNGCEVAQVFDIQAGGAPVISDSILIPVHCFGENSGEISVSVTLGQAPYFFQWSTGPGTETLSNLSAGIYALTSTDANGCSTTAQFLITEPNAITIFADIDSTSCTSTTGDISITVTGGSAPFAYSWNNGQVTPVVNGLTPGTYTVTISDENGCSMAQSFTLDPGGAPVLSNSEVIPVNCTGESNGQITVEVTGGVSPYQFQWSTGGISDLLTNLPAGDYTLTATDANGCLTTLQFTVTEPPLLSLVGVIDSSTCATNSGNIAVTPQGGVSPFTYLWNDGQTTSALSAVLPGNYTLTTTDANGCSSSATYTILPGGSPLLAASTVTPASCFGNNDGSIVVSASGGVLPYQFNWSTGQGTDSLISLQAGNYQLTITDANACTSVADFTVTSPAVLNAVLGTQADTCGQSTGAIQVTTSGGTAPYTYLWSDGSTAVNRLNLAEGPWEVTVTDVNGCLFTQSAAIIAVTILPQFLLPGDTLTCVKTSVNVTPDPAPSNWVFQWQTPDGMQLQGAGQTLGVAGQYSVTATNEFGCEIVQLVDIETDTQEPVALAAENDLFIPCNQTAVLLDGSGSSIGAAFMAHWTQESNGQVVWDSMAYQAFAETAGTYILSVTNLENGCIQTDTVQVTTAERISAVAIELEGISCFGREDGVIQVVTVTGGSAPYTYALDGQTFSTDSSFDGLGEGSYVVEVLDANGCNWQSTPLLFSEPEPLTLNLMASEKRVDQGDEVVLQADVVPAGAVLSLIQWSPPTYFSLPAALQETVELQETTLFQLEIEDPNGCTASDTIRVFVRRDAIYVPNVFQPGSERNPQFTVFGAADLQEIKVMQLYDRWGELLFDKREFPPNDPSLGWDGTFRGQAVAPGVYVYYLVLLTVEGKEVTLKGNVT
ncbi:MAG: gliding motility-associated C-terminal domain-containing protein, partial [Saprospiraceae bacterium]|nr:gliding motility-associated C-terminal domain-containing protein [Saprospiraceae bacterium]